MFIFNRRPYIVNRQCQKNLIESKKVEAKSPVTANESKESINLDAFSKTLDELAKSIKKLQESLEFLDLRQKKLESDIERLNSKFKIMEMLNAQNEEVEERVPYPNSSNVSDMDRPVMPGSGFSSITPNYLRGLKNK